MAVFDNRQKELLTILKQTQNPIPLDQLCAQLHVSRRTVYYLVNKCNEELQYHAIAPIQNKRGQGYILDDEQKHALDSLFVQAQTSTLFKPKERVYYMLCWMLYPRSPIHVETIMNQMDISRNSVFNDLNRLKKELSNYDLKLTFDIHKGYAIHGESFHKRAVLLYYLKLLLQDVHYRELHFLQPGEVEVFYHRLVQISADLGNEYNDRNLVSIACLLSVIRHFNEKFDFSLLELRDLGETGELQLIDHYFQDFNVHERLYLAVHLLGSKAGCALKVQDDENDIRLFELAQRMTGIFEHLACISLVDKLGLINSLYMHFKLSMYYYHLSIQIVNPLMNEVKDTYSALYQIIKVITRDIAEAFPFPVMESEIVYITMHFAGHLRKGMGVFYRRIRILVICPSGISTSTLLRREIEDLYSNVLVVAATTADNIAEYEDDIDFIVSTIDVKSEVPWIKVNPILTLEDKSRIASLMMLNFETYEMESGQVNGLFDILKKYVKKEEMEKMKQDVFQYLRSGNVLVQVEKPQQLRIFDVLKAENIVLVDAKMDWITSLRLASVPLLEKNIIKEKYVDAMINLVDTYGPYIVLQNKVAIAHANPKHGANMMGLSLLINHRDILFADGVTIQFLFVLSNPDQEKHIHLLRDIMLLSSNAKLLHQLVELDDAFAVLTKLNTFSGGYSD